MYYRATKVHMLNLRENKDQTETVGLCGHERSKKRKECDGKVHQYVASTICVIIEGFRFSGHYPSDMALMEFGRDKSTGVREGSL